MECNKVVYNENVLIDLTQDTVQKETLLTGVTAHNKAGEIITGTFLQGYPSTLVVENTTKDSSGEAILDESGLEILGRYIYERK